MQTERNKATVAVIVCAFIGLLWLWQWPEASREAQAALSGDSGGSAIFAQFEGIDGESRARDHENWCELLSFRESHNARARAVAFEDVTLTKPLDKAGPKLAEAVCRNTVIPVVRIHVTRSFATGVKTCCAYELKNARLTGYEIEGASQGQNPAVEAISLRFEEITTTYTEYDATGQARGNVQYTWRVGGTVTPLLRVR
jgi:type VI secretion system Hcp family effector